MPIPHLPPDLAALSLSDVTAAMAAQRLPPVDKWHPPHCGHSDMRIARDGSWYHQGGLIRRPAMVRLFSSILRREADGRYVLVTPAEMLDIDVEDAPFHAVELKSDGEGRNRRLAFRLNTDDLVIADAEHPIRVTMGDAGPRPVVMVRGGMEALITRPVYYELAGFAEDDSAAPAGVWSEGSFFPLDAQP
jgi:uncharacterized protein